MELVETPSRRVLDNEPVLILRRLSEPEVALVRNWLEQPHVARWYLSASTIDDEIRDVVESLLPGSLTEVLLVLEDQRPIGWCQWYRCEDYPEHAAGVGALPGDLGIDYAIGEPDLLRCGIGTRLIAALLEYLWRRHPSAGVVADPEAANVASRMVLEKNGFRLLEVRLVASEPNSGPMAIYRAAPAKSP
jgi:aminoglycoside 6'-N-acetyltransferase